LDDRQCTHLHRPPKLCLVLYGQPTKEGRNGEPEGDSVHLWLSIDPGYDRRRKDHQHSNQQSDCCRDPEQGARLFVTEVVTLYGCHGQPSVHEKSRQAREDHRHCNQAKCRGIQQPTENRNCCKVREQYRDLACRTMQHATDSPALQPLAKLLARKVINCAVPCAH
jgi:hypothetical protein